MLFIETKSSKLNKHTLTAFYEQTMFTVCLNRGYVGAVVSAVILNFSIQ